mgnify:CR=1 FL=1
MSLARFWRGQKQRYQLGGFICPQCGAIRVTARPVCVECAQRQVEEKQQAQAWVWAFSLLYTMGDEPLVIKQHAMADLVN